MNRNLWIVFGAVLWMVRTNAVPVNIDYEKESNSRWGASMNLGGFVTHNEVGVSGQYLTKDFREVVGTAFDKIDAHVRENYLTSKFQWNWVWGIVAAVIGIQLEVAYLIYQVVSRIKRKIRMADASGKENVGLVRKEPRV